MAGFSFDLAFFRLGILGISGIFSSRFQLKNVSFLAAITNLINLPSTLLMNLLDSSHPPHTAPNECRN